MPWARQSFRAERPRRCDGDTGPQKAQDPPSKGVLRLRSGSPVPQ
jgi:hypothetical protein